MKFLKVLTFLLCLGVVLAQNEEAETVESETEEAEQPEPQEPETEEAEKEEEHTEEPEKEESEKEESETEESEKEEPETEELENEESQKVEVTEEADTPTPAVASSTQSSNTCAQQVHDLLTQIEAAENQSRAEIAAATASIESNNAATRNDVKVILESLDPKFKIATTEKAEQCKAEILEELNEKTSGSCNEAPSLNAQPQADSIAELKAEAGEICNNCEQEVDQNDCVSSSTANIVERVKDLQSDISAQIKNTQVETAACAQSERIAAIDSIRSASISFDICILSS